MIKAVIFDMYETLITLYNSPNYFGAHMAKDMGLEESVFLKDWRPTEEDRSNGTVTLEEVVEQIMRKHNCYREDIFQKVVQRRIESKRVCFEHLDPWIIPMLSGLKNRGIKIGLISNCFSEEAELIRKSVLFPYFDAPFMSYEQGIIKPNKEIFYRCMDKLEVNAEECIYIGDGGSFELQVAEELGMMALQAAWYLKEGTKQPTKRMNEFIQLDCPCDVFRFLT